ncbi:alpha-L-fucosidase [Mucilaginibacter sabulilitoris]|uniref:alpha-L-fucosidase n=1 Tax=Mucilaginibacter sabulilitoris TaxID=1173583 RepID=A0ABZ0TGX5_9SPHI|nr:alpha-L-fucosidase [Mucilaginibacter sabulilitoris]WPU92263.1 alpha-L-fucosidase [Mucilaginibacter sabulilitoris]
MKKKKAALLIALVMSTCTAIAQQKTPKAVMDQFMDKRFGMFIHFGPVTQRGTEIGWSRNDQVAQADYDSLYHEFNPRLFNADVWVKTAKDAGMKYLVITAKHHDGFCLWPTAYSDYNVANSPFKRDIVGELAEACKKQDVTFCIYFTVLDWHDPDYPIHNPHDTTQSKGLGGNMTAFKTRMKNELREVITKYKPFMLWFDGYWEKPWTTADGKEIYQFIKSVDANVIVNNRLGKVNDKLDGDAVGDFLTPEQTIGKLNMNEPWESCITICNQWAWKPNDPMKSLKQCLQTLVTSASGNGNLLFNVGPAMDGHIEGRQVKRLQEMGAWLKLYGESIYGTQGGPYVPNETYGATRKGNKVYLHIFQRKDGTLSIPALANVKITKAYFMNGGAVIIKTDKDNYKIELPATLPDENCSVIVLELNKDAVNIPVIPVKA